ncbi:hypothetical protein, partial [Thiolapillus sp.]
MVVIDHHGKLFLIIGIGDQRAGMLGGGVAFNRRCRNRQGRIATLFNSSTAWRKLTPWRFMTH